MLLPPGWLKRKMEPFGIACCHSAESLRQYAAELVHLICELFLLLEPRCHLWRQVRSERLATRDLKRRNRRGYTLVPEIVIRWALVKPAFRSTNGYPHIPIRSISALPCCGKTLLAIPVHHVLALRLLLQLVYPSLSRQSWSIGVVTKWRQRDGLPPPGRSWHRQTPASMYSEAQCRRGRFAMPPQGCCAQAP